MGAGITLLRAWANAGNLTAPSNAKIDQGWVVGEQPACEYENERMNTRDNTINDIINYLNAGVPLSDILDGSCDLEDSVFKTTDSSDGDNASIGPSFVSVGRGTGAAQTTSRLQRYGIDYINANIGSYVLNDAVLQFDISGLTWVLNTDFGAKAYSAVCDINTGRPFENTSYAAYDGSVVMRSPSGKQESRPVVAIQITDESGYMHITQITIINDLVVASNYYDHRLYLRSTFYSL